MSVLVLKPFDHRFTQVGFNCTSVQVWGTPLLSVIDAEKKRNYGTHIESLQSTMSMKFLLKNCINCYLSPQGVLQMMQFWRDGNAKCQLVKNPKGTAADTLGKFWIFAPHSTSWKINNTNKCILDELPKGFLGYILGKMITGLFCPASILGEIAALANLEYANYQIYLICLETDMPGCQQGKN